MAEGIYTRLRLGHVPYPNVSLLAGLENRMKLPLSLMYMKHGTLREFAWRTWDPTMYPQVGIGTLLHEDIEKEIRKHTCCNPDRDLDKFDSFFSQW